MREILFRGLRTDGEGWVYGYYLPTFTGIAKIAVTYDHITGTIEAYEVIPETVGQYTGLKDKNGKEIYEGDVLGGCNGSVNGQGWGWENYTVKYRDNGQHNVPIDWGSEKNWDNTHWFEVIGNIHENPELLGEKHGQSN